MKITGIIEKVDLDGGVWTLKSEDGTSYRLKGGDSSLYAQGDKATIEGKELRNMMGIGMNGPIFEVKKYKKI